MKITKTTKEVWSFKSNPRIENNNETDKETVTTWDIDIKPEEMPELVINFTRAGLGDIKPLLNSFLKNIKDKIDC